jgi:hypothetical protein
LSEPLPSSWLEEVLSARIGDRSLSFIFPSQLVADAWAGVAASRFSLGAVESDRFIGWDSFKEASLSPRKKERPANRLSRSIWAAGIVSRQARRPFLKRLAGPHPPSPAFVSFFAALPPALKRAAEAIEARGLPAATGRESETGLDAGFQDLLELKEDYSGFLAAHDLFEPGWQGIEVLPGGRCLIIAPELIEDFAAYEAALASHAPRIEILRLPTAAETGPKPPKLLRFDTAYEELRWTFLEVGRLLDAGVSPEDILVTLPGLEEGLAYAARAAEFAGVPVALKAASPLSASPFGRLLREIDEAASGGFDFEAFRALLLDRFATWKSPEAVRDLVRFGVERHAYASYTQDGKRVDIWEKSFELGGGSADLKAFYRRLTRDLRKIQTAPDFTALKTAVFAFRTANLDERGWMEAELRQVERAMVELDGLATAERELGAVGSIASPFALYLSVLEETGYLPQGGGGPAVAVCPYRVSALHPARHHFVLGASQDGIRVAYAGLSFLREDQKQALGEADSDASPDFARAYHLSAPATSFSYSVEAFGGWSVPHPFFSAPREGSTSPAEEAPAPPTNFRELREACPLRAEAAAWRGSPFPARILPRQAAAFDATLPALAPPSSRFSADRAKPKTLALLEPRITNKEGRLRLSATTLHSYLACPFAWLLERALRIEEEETGVAFFDALLAGSMAHAALRRLLEDMGGLGPIAPTHRAAYREAAIKAVRDILPGFEAEEGPFLLPMFESYVPLLTDRLFRLIDALVLEEGWEAGELELGLERPYPDLGLVDGKTVDAVLEGYIDRLAKRADGEGRAIVDYKKRRLPVKAALVVQEDAGLGDYQIAAYVALCAWAKKPVEEAWYWSIEEAKMLRVLGRGGIKMIEDYGPELAALDEALGFVARGIRSGNFSPAGSGGSSCEGCGWKAICRERYATE